MNQPIRREEIDISYGVIAFNALGIFLFMSAITSALAFASFRIIIALPFFPALVDVSRFDGWEPDLQYLLRAPYGYVSGICIFIFIASFAWTAAAHLQHEAFRNALLASRRKPRRNPPPRMFSSHTEMRNHTRLVKRQHPLLPKSEQHYKQLYFQLKQQDFRISRPAIERAKVGGVNPMNSIAKNYKRIIAHWNDGGFIDGYETGDPALDDWYLSERGQYVFYNGGFEDGYEVESD